MSCRINFDQGGFWRRSGAGTGVLLPGPARRGRLVSGGRRRRLKIQASWPWAEAITTAWRRIDALSQAP
jgi:hypothetical protein